MGRESKSKLRLSLHGKTRAGGMICVKEKVTIPIIQKDDIAGLFKSCAEKNMEEVPTIPHAYTLGYNIALRIMYVVIINGTDDLDVALAE